MSSIIASSAAAGRGVDAGHRPRGVVELGEAQRLGQPAGRVDGEHDDLRGRARPRAAPRAAAVVVLPTPPEPQHTMIRVSGSSQEGVDVERGGGACVAAERRPSDHPLLGERVGEPRMPPASVPSGSSGSR